MAGRKRTAAAAEAKGNGKKQSKGRGKGAAESARAEEVLSELVAPAHPALEEIAVAECLPAQAEEPNPLDTSSGHATARVTVREIQDWDRFGHRHSWHAAHVDRMRTPELPAAEVGPFRVLKHSDDLVAAGVDEDDFGDASWRRGLEELRRTQRPTRPDLARLSSPEEQADSEKLIRSVQAAMRNGDWAPAIVQAQFALLTEVSTAVQQLTDDQLFQLLAACSEHWLENPHEHLGCYRWISLVLEHAGIRLIGRQEFRQVVQPLLQDLQQSFDLVHPGRGVIACIGRWRLVLELARVREAASGSPAAAATTQRATAAASADSLNLLDAAVAAAAEFSDSCDEEEQEEDGPDERDEDEPSEEVEEDAVDSKGSRGVSRGGAAMAQAVLEAPKVNGRKRPRRAE